MKIRVMLVDDEPFILQGLSMLIDWEKVNCEIVKTAANGKEAYEYLKENRVDLILADIEMPEMTGLALLEKCGLTVTDKETAIIDALKHFHMV